MLEMPEMPEMPEMAEPEMLKCELISKGIGPRHVKDLLLFLPLPSRAFHAQQIRQSTVTCSVITPLIDTARNSFR